MISISKPKSSDVKGFKLKEGFDINNMMAIYDGSEVAGITYYENLGEEEALLYDVNIKDGFKGQYYGDSIVKAILNVADKRGIKKMFVNTIEENKEFFVKVGFLRPCDVEVELDYSTNNNTMVALLPEFFNTACRSKK